MDDEVLTEDGEIWVAYTSNDGIGYMARLGSYLTKADLEAMIEAVDRRTVGAT